MLHTHEAQLNSHCAFTHQMNPWFITLDSSNFALIVQCILLGIAEWKYTIQNEGWYQKLEQNTALLHTAQIKGTGLYFQVMRNVVFYASENFRF